MTTKVTWPQILAWRLRRQFVSEGGASDAVAVARRLCGVQAQVASSARLAVAIRCGGPAHDEIDRALWVDRTLVKTWIMRGTLHLVPSDTLADHCAVLGTSRFWEKGSWQRGHGVTAGEIAALIDTIPGVLSAETSALRATGEETSARRGKGAPASGDRPPGAPSAGARTLGARPSAAAEASGDQAPVTWASDDPPTGAKASDSGSSGSGTSGGGEVGGGASGSGASGRGPIGGAASGGGPVGGGASGGGAYDDLECGGRAMTREELVEAVVAATGDAHLKEALTSGWGALLKPLSHLGELCYGPPRDGRVTFTTPRAWLPGWPAALPPHEEAGVRVVRAFLGAHGPATPEMFDAWLFRGTARKALLKGWFRDLAPELTEVEADDGRRLLMLTEHLDDLAGTSPSSEVHLLPGFDQYILGAPRDLAPLIPPPLKARVSRQAGWISPVVVHEGRVAGVWEARDGRLTVDLAHPVPQASLDEALARVHALLP
ncbi:DNA glycosylase AlkZ-like family protein [Nonomuraea phyllanthi]|uniref:DNA glycosylase AlkZ-like family protein n=1 Tax=Nonomuraea phyllanthi TaxID=2219224 RepID=UPI001D1582CA|nr:crosslink repair DNA glycosylase YcaQ family protein [Nonomuraea phyllanthi]